MRTADPPKSHSPLWEKGRQPVLITNHLDGDAGGDVRVGVGKYGHVHKLAVCWQR